MRLHVRLHSPTPASIPINYAAYLTAAVYHLLGTSDQEYSRFLHDEGYASEEPNKRFKLFVFSELRSRNHRADGPTLVLGPGEIDWWIASPIEPFLRHLATGLLTAPSLQVHLANFAITGVETLPAPDFSAGQARFTCLSPIVASVRRPEEQGGGATYLKPTETELFSEIVRRNLLRKRQALGLAGDGDSLQIQFAQDYLEQRSGTKLVEYKGIRIRGAFAPFTATGSPDLLRIGYECGFGEKNSGGFGMVEVKARPQGPERLR